MAYEDDLATAYQERELLKPFSDLGTNSPELDYGLDNLLAYLMVAATTHPVPGEVERAETIAERLLPTARENEDFRVLDTVACVWFCAGRKEEAADLFARVLDLIKKSPGWKGDDATVADLNDFQNLVERRLAAAEQKAEGLPLETDKKPYQGDGEQTAGAADDDPDTDPPSSDPRPNETTEAEEADRAAP